MKNSFIYVSFLILFSWKGISQITQTMLDEVLESKNKTTAYTYKKTDIYGEVTISVNYIGDISTKNNDYQVITYTNYFKERDSFKSAILFFNKKNAFQGKYSFGKAPKIIAKIVGQKIIIQNTESYCDSTIENILDISDGLPEKFNTKCDSRTGDGRLLEDEY